MRVVAGVHGGRRLAAPPGRGTRPTTDKVREALFSSLASLVDLEGAAVADLFAGSGALGIEALSRGAARATFVEADRRAADTLAANLAALGLGPPAAVLRRGDAVAAAATPEVAGADLVLADPPYAFTGWDELLGRLAAAGSDALVVAETGADLAPPPGWLSLRVRTYGSTVVSMLRPASGRTP